MKETSNIQTSKLIVYSPNEIQFRSKKIILLSIKKFEYCIIIRSSISSSELELRLCKLTFAVEN